MHNTVNSALDEAFFVRAVGGNNSCRLVIRTKIKCLSMVP